jgi:hypothetical protein
MTVERWKLAGNGNTYFIPAYPGFRGSGSRGSSLAVAQEEMAGILFAQHTPIVRCCSQRIFSAGDNDSTFFMTVLPRLQSCQVFSASGY